MKEDSFHKGIQVRAGLGFKLGLRCLWTPRWRNLVGSGVNGVELKRDLGGIKPLQLQEGMGRDVRSRDKAWSSCQEEN